MHLKAFSSCMFFWQHQHLKWSKQMISIIHATPLRHGYPPNQHSHTPTCKPRKSNISLALLLDARKSLMADGDSDANNADEDRCSERPRSHAASLMFATRYTYGPPGTMLCDYHGVDTSEKWSNSCLEEARVLELKKKACICLQNIMSRLGYLWCWCWWYWCFIGNWSDDDESENDNSSDR